MTDPIEHGHAIATRLRAEAALADRPGQMNRLEAEANSVDALVEQLQWAESVIHQAIICTGGASSILEHLNGYTPRQETARAR